MQRGALDQRQSEITRDHDLLSDRESRQSLACHLRFVALSHTCWRVAGRTKHCCSVRAVILFLVSRRLGEFAESEKGLWDDQYSPHSAKYVRYTICHLESWLLDSARLQPPRRRSVLECPNREIACTGSKCLGFERPRLYRRQSSHVHRRPAPK